MRNGRLLLLLAGFQITLGCGLAGSRSDTEPDARWSLPVWVDRVLSDGGYYQRYTVSLTLNPWYQRGRFDGDTAVDAAVQIVEKATGKSGIAVIHRADAAVFILGAGTSFVGYDRDEFPWVGVWRVEGRDLLVGTPVVGSELLYLAAKPNSDEGGLIWWDGSAYLWTQWGD